MKKLKNPKIFIPLFIILLALGAFAAVAISNGHGPMAKNMVTNTDNRTL